MLIVRRITTAGFALPFPERVRDSTEGGGVSSAKAESSLNRANTSYCSILYSSICLGGPERKPATQRSVALTLEDKLAGQKRIKALETHRNDKRRTLFDAQDQVDKQREELIATIEGKLERRISNVPLFSIRWRL
jgi:hypothetical protein